MHVGRYINENSLYVIRYHVFRANVYSQGEKSTTHSVLAHMSRSENADVLMKVLVQILSFYQICQFPTRYYGVCKKPCHNAN